MNNSPPINDAVTELTPCHLGTPKRREGGKEEEGYCAGENTKKRKSNGKATPRKKGSKNSTPKKNVSANGINGTTSPDSAQKIDLRLEAKLSAEENSRMFAGRQIHPFFSSWKVEKKFQEPADSERSLCMAEREDGRITCGPIHVFENIQDDTSSLDWRDWTFFRETTITNCSPESSNSSVLKGSVESLNFDNLSALDPSGALISQNALSCSDQLSILPENLQEISPANSAMLANEQTICPQMPEDAKVELEVDEVSTFSGQVSIFRKSDTEPLSRFFQESMRSYYHSCEDKTEGSLWTHKYRPTKAFEVCGNDESVNFLRDWLHLWHERRYQRRKDSSNKDQSDMQDNDDDYNCSDSDYDSKDIYEDSLQNVLLITGPIGSGKSAAVYACAQEQGFEVLELNASDCRNGTAVKQYFGDTLGSLGFKRLLEHTVSSQKKTVKLPPDPALPNGKGAEKMDDGMIELITISDDEAHSPRRLHCQNNVFTCEDVQTLILVEDVDILFPEDRGCIAAIQRIAGTAKGPIILTSNSNNPGLPDNLDRLHVSFSLPLPDELLCHLYTVCVTEEVNIHPLLLWKFIQSCDEDIRKTIMHLQFWFQSKEYSKDRKVQTVYGSLPFDLEAGHQILPKIIPWSFPSELSKLIEKEFAKSITIMEENSCLQGLVKKELHINERQNDLDKKCMGTDCIEANKVEMINRNSRSITDCSKFESQYNAISELSTFSEWPVASSWQKGQRELVVMSSNSEDENPNNGQSLDVHNEAYKRQSLEGNSETPSNFQLNQCYNSISFCQLVCSGLVDLEEEQCKYLETANDACLNETCNSFYVSSLPESMLVPETAIENGIETMSGAVSSGHLAGPVEFSSNNELAPFTFSVCKRLAKLPQNSDSLVDIEIPESSPKAAVQDLRDENKVYNVMDECSHADFKLKSKFVEFSPSTETDMVQNLWRKLRDCRTDLRQHAISEQLGAIQVIKLASGLSNLISEADFLFRNHQQKQCGTMEPPMSLSDEAAFSWYDELVMMSTIAEHGFCFYAKHVSDVGSKLGCENRVELTSEMLASSRNIMALGKLSRQDSIKCMNKNIYTKKQLDVNNPRNYTMSENKTSLFNVIQSIVPARLSLALKGIAFNEYLSSVRQISMSEGIRMSQGAKKKRGRRGRGAQHYLSRGTMMLSPEDISLVCEGDLYRQISSQHIGNVESNRP